MSLHSMGIQAALPALCTELKLHATNGVPVVNSRDAAEMFGKRHDLVLRDIDGLLAQDGVSSNLRTPWYRLKLVENEQNRQTYRSFDLTRQGFTLLVMGWTGERALQFKIRYIEAFDAMEAALKDGSAGPGLDLIAAIREIVAPLIVRIDYRNIIIDRIASDIAQLKTRIPNGRRNLKSTTKINHIDALRLLGGRCPCCGTAEVVANGEKSPFAEFDHFYASSRAGAEHTWLICKPCHTELTSGRVARDQRETVFKAYQDKRRRLPGRQPNLFG